MADTELNESGQYEDRRESDKSKEDFVARWLAEIELSAKPEESWRKDADTAREVYRAEGKGERQRFNILYSNIQTEVPALYNSTPSPDVRTRYHDEDELSRLAGQVIERVLSFSIDQYDFDETIKSAVQDRQLAGRGQVRVRYKPYEYQGKLYQEVNCELVQWKHYGFGPCTDPADRPWEYFEHFLTREQLTELNPEIGGGLKLDFTVAPDGKSKTRPDAAPNVFKRARIYEIWDKQTRKVLWIAPGYTAGPVRVDDDPLGLIGFFATPAPMYAIRTTDSTVPKCPYTIIKPLADELEEITRRIQALIKVCRWRGFRHPAIPFERMEEAEDGELVAPVDGSEILTLVQNGTLEKAIWLMPIDQLMKTVQQLYVQRDQIMNLIFQVSGLSDIIRGATDPDETLGAQEIKANFGTMRLQQSQKDVARFCRDLFRIKAEIACNKFDSENLLMMTGMKQPSRQDVAMAQAKLAQAQQMAAQAPQMGHNGGPPMDPEAEQVASAVPWENVVEVVKSGMMRTYRIDIETDSTVRGDVRQAQQNAGLFLDGTAKFFQAMGPAVETKIMPLDVAIDIYSSMARSFKLGKQAEDALARWGQEATKAAKNPAPAEPSPEEIKAKAELEKMKMQMGMAQQKHQLDVQKTQMTIAADAQSKQMELGARERELQMEQQKADMDMENDVRKAYLDFEIQQRQAAFDMQSAERKSAIDAQTQARKMAMNERMAEERHRHAMSQPARGRA